MFPLCVHIEGPGDSLVGRPTIEIHLDCSATNPLFLQGSDGFVGAPGAPSFYSQNSLNPYLSVDSPGYGFSEVMGWRG